MPSSATGSRHSTIAIRMVEKSLADGYFVGSRGSVGSSLVATCTGITEVNPLKPHYVCPGCRWSDFEPAQQVDSGLTWRLGSVLSAGPNFGGTDRTSPSRHSWASTARKVPDIDLNFSGEEQAEIFKFASELSARATSSGPYHRDHRPQDELRLRETLRRRQGTDPQEGGGDQTLHRA